MNEWDVVIVGGGPAGLNAALALGRARKRVLLCDAGPRRNAAAVEIHNFVTQDGTSPTEFRRVAREQLRQYASVEVRDENVAAITGERGAFRVKLPSGEVRARRVLLTTGLVDEPPAIEGLREAWGHTVIQCPYCHGWELRDRPWGYLAQEAQLAHAVPFTLMLRAWSREVTFFTNGLALPAELRAQLEAGGVRVVNAKLQKVIGGERVELADGASVPNGALFTHPPQRQVDVVRSLGLALTEEGFVRVDPMRCETSTPGIFAAGDLTTRAQGAIFAAAAGMQAAVALNMELTMERPL